MCKSDCLSDGWHILFVVCKSDCLSDGWHILFCHVKKKCLTECCYVFLSMCEMIVFQTGDVHFFLCVKQLSFRRVTYTSFFV